MSSKYKNLPISSKQINEIRDKNYDLAHFSRDPYLFTLSQIHEQYYRKLKNKYRDALEFYSGAGYKAINNCLRTGTSIPNNTFPKESQKEFEKKIKKFTSDLITIINNAPVLTQPITVFRAIEPTLAFKLPKLNPGDTTDLFSKYIISTSTKPALSSKIFAGKQCCLFALHLPIGSHCFFLGKNSFLPEEFEILLPPGYSFKIVSLPTSQFDPKKPDLVIYDFECINCASQPTKQRCQCLKSSGERCTRDASTGSLYCWQHFEFMCKKTNCYSTP